MSPATNQACVAIIAGEASGDQHGAKLINAMQKKNPGLFYCGIGGPALKQAGVRILVDASELTVVGITEVFAKIPGILKGMGVIKRLLNSLKPDLLILIDFPDFNLHIAAAAKKLGIPVLYYISPQVWAWRRGRVKRIGRLVDHMAVILPFEEQFYTENNVPATFVGHPLLDSPLPSADQIFSSGVEGQVTIGLVPGSRDKEISRHLPVMLDAAHILKDRLKHARFIISHAPSIERKQIEAIVAGHSGRMDVEIISNGVETVFEHSDLIVAASGTVTLQAAIHGTPMVIIYKVSPISFLLGRALVRVPHIGLANLVAGQELVPELVQSAASADNIASAVENMLADKKHLNHLKQQLFDLRDVLGGGGASDRVAELALGMLGR
ncbi:MAG: lipid-A-disaccharide synthase [Desulfobacteraceae bacterium]|jgi:lipid-A-disaccharide synthase|nr:lipid-A-disaccharide synthase [Desulfobacteraceae bacterium]